MDDINGAQSSMMVPKPQALFTVPGRHPLPRLEGTPNPGKGFGPTLLLGAGWGPPETVSSSHSLPTGGENVLSALG